MNFLIADVLSNRKILSALLGRRGVDTDLAQDGVEAVEIITNAIQNKATTVYDLIFMDNLMPKMVCICY